MKTSNKKQSSPINRTMLDRTVLRDQIREYLIDAILNEHFKEGDRIVETRIAKQLGVSQGAVREALRELEWLGFLETKPYSGTYVKNLSIDDLLEIYPVRAALEALGAKLAAPNFSDEDLADLKELVDEMVEVSKAGDTRGMVERNYAFHQAIIDKSGNSMLIRYWRMFQFSYWTTLSTAELSNELVYLASRHYIILDALHSHNPDNAAQAMRDHIQELVYKITQRKEKSASQTSQADQEKSSQT